MSEHRGFVLISVLVSTFFVLAAGAATAQLVVNNYQTAMLEQYRVGAQFAADAGIDKSLQTVNNVIQTPDPNDDDWPGTGGEVTLFSDTSHKTTFEATVTPGGDEFQKFLHVTGRTYVPADSTDPRVERSYEVELRAITIGPSSVVTGVGGLIMTNSSKIIGGTVFVNGTITMSNSSTIGLESSPVNVRVANNVCPLPPNSTYPQKCDLNENDNPINISSPAQIYSDGVDAEGNEISAVANYQFDTTNIAGLDETASAGGSVPVKPLPFHDRSAQIATINPANEMTGSEASCTSNGGSVTWLANTKIAGDVEVSKKCTVTVYGDVWITGNVRMSQSAEIVAAEGISKDNPPVLMIDGQDGFYATNGASLVSNSVDTGFRVITYWSEATCSPDCTDVTGLDLYNSSDHSTIQVFNSSEGPNTEFYARWSQVELSNSGNIGALVGQIVKLTNSSTVTFGTEVTEFGGISAWVIESYKRDF